MTPIIKSSPGNISVSYLLAVFGGIVSSTLGALVLLGWYTHNAILIQVLPDFVPMQFNTALAFLLGGFGLLALIENNRHLGMVCGLFVTLAGLLTLIEYIFGIGLNIDELMMTHYITVQTSHPGRMAPNTALCFLMTGIALISFAMAKPERASMNGGLLGSLICGLSVVALAGYAVGLETAYGWGKLTRMAVHTAGGFVLLGLSMTAFAWNKNVAISPFLPSWFPLSIGIGIVMVIFSSWLALNAYGLQLMQKYGDTGKLPLVNNILLTIGILLAATVSSLLYLIQLPNKREKELAALNERLTAEMDERRQMEEELKVNAERFERWKASNFIGIIQSDAKGGIDDVNDALLRILGYSRQDLLDGKLDWMQLTPPEFLHLDDKAMKEAAIKGFWTPFEKEYFHKDGHRVPIIIGGSIFKEAPEKYIMFVVDISKRKRTEEALRQYAHIVFGSTDMLALLDKKYTYKAVNPAYCKAFNLSHEQIIGRTPKEVFGENFFNGTIKPNADNCLTGKEIHYQAWFDFPILGKQYMEISYYPYADDDNNIQGFVVNGRNITERKQMEDRLNNTNRLYATLGQINQIITKEQDRQKLFQEICNIAIEFGKFKLAWIGLIDKNSKLVNPVAFSGKGADYLHNIRISLTDPLTGKGPTGKAIHERRAVAFNDLKNNPDYSPWREQALKKGYRSSAAFPIELNATVIGSLNVYAIETDFFNENEMRLLEKAALDISFALEKLEEDESRRKAEKALRESEERFRIVSGLSTDVLWEWNIANGVLDWFGDIDGLLGFKKNEFPRTIDAWEKIIHPEDHDDIMKKLHGYLENEAVWHTEYRIIKKDGSIRYWNDRGETRRDKNGKPLFVTGAILDITEQKLAEKQIEKQQYYLSKAQEIGHIGTWELDFVDNTLIWTDEVYKIFNVPLDSELSHEIFLQHVYPDDREYVHREWCAAMRGKPYDIEYRFEIDGDIKWAREKAEFTFDLNGEAVSAIGFTQDISRRKKFEEELVESDTRLLIAKERLDMALKATKSGVWDWDITTGEVFFDSNWLLMLGYEPGELKPDISSWERLVHPDDMPSVKEALQAHFEQKTARYEIENRLLKKNGEYQWSLDRGIVIKRDRDGKPLRMVGTDTDISKRKQSEEALRHSQKMDALGKLTGGIAHDYNNMLAIILGFTELLERALSDQPRLLKYVQEIYAAGKRGAKLTKKLQTFSRQKNTNAKKLNINDILQGLRDMLEKTLTARIELVFELEDNLSEVLLDSDELEDTIVSISINAMHAMDGQGRLTIHTGNVRIHEKDAPSSRLKPGNYVMLSISDTGCGMEASVKEKIFDPFFSTKGKTSTGLGLSQAYGFVERSGGMITVHSEPNGGSRFDLYFPDSDEWGRT